MKATTLRFLVCPSCRDGLELLVEAEDGHDVMEGRLRAPGCGREYRFGGQSRGPCGRTRTPRASCFLQDLPKLALAAGLASLVTWMARGALLPRPTDAVLYGSALGFGVSYLAFRAGVGWCGRRSGRPLRRRRDRLRGLITRTSTRPGDAGASRTDAA